MFASVSPSSSTKSIGRNITLQYVLAFVCMGLLIIFVAGTIVIALIPIYLAKNTVPRNAASFRSQPVTMAIEVEQDRTVTGSRRKRLEGDLYNYVGGQFTSAGNDILKSQLLPYVTSQNLAQDLIISNVSLGYKGDYRRKRFALSKRAAYYKHVVVMVVTFRVVYFTTCSYRCQVNIGPRIRNVFLALPKYAFQISNVPMYVNNVYVLAPRIQMITIVYIDVIVPGTSPVTQYVQTVTVTLTSTTPSATAIVG